MPVYDRIRLAFGNIHTTTYSKTFKLILNIVKYMNDEYGRNKNDNYNY